MPSLPLLKAPQVVRMLERADFVIVRQRGSHVRFKHSDGRVVTVPVHGAQDIGRGLLRKIRRDADLAVDDLQRLLEE